MDPKQAASTAKAHFESGCNCAQAVFLTFAQQYGLTPQTALALSSSFGGGMGRLREVCGAVSGMLMAAGLQFGGYDPTDHAAKQAHYGRVQTLAKQFEEKNGSIICRELLGLTERRDAPTPEARTPAYYAKRPCSELVASAAEIFAQYLNEQRPQQ